MGSININLAIFNIIFYILCLIAISSSSNHTSLKGIQDAAPGNVTKHYSLVSKRRTVLTINFDKGLRSRVPKNKKKNQKITSLLYEEFDEGKKLNSFMMYNLDDVSIFFKTFLDTEICEVECEPKT